MRWTIQFKMVVLFSVIIFIGFVAMLIAFNQLSEKNIYREVDEDMVQSKVNLDIAINQYFLLLNKRINENSIENEVNEIEKQIGISVGGAVNVYRPDSSSFKYSKGDNKHAMIYREDLEAAAKAKVAYSTTMNNGHVTARLSVPLLEEGKVIAIVSLEKDYSGLLLQHTKFQDTITLFAIVIFIFVFLGSIFISSRITKPIRVLTQHAKLVGQGSLNTDIQVHTRDEIGQLAGSYSNMIQHIKTQIDVIQRERDEVKQVQERSKVFFDNVTHELKTPLTTILGYAQILRDNGFSDQAFFEKGLNYIINESRRLNTMVVDILERSAAAAPGHTFRFETIDVSSILQETCDDMSIKAAKYNITVVSEIEGPLFLTGDAHKLKEAFINVLDNSIKYGYVNSLIEVSAFRLGNEIVIRIRDQGEGIREEALERIFEPFYRENDVNREEKGSAGLGLSIVRNTIEQHGGKVKMASILNRGSEVRMTLPERRL